MISSLPNINEFDLAFVVDSTGSMGGLIKAAQRQLLDVVDSLSDAAGVSMQMGVVEYRDFPPQDTLPSRVYPFTENLRKVKRAINGLKASGGGDACEAVFAGLASAWDELRWRQHSRRIAILVGDAPPHGVGGRGDGFPKGCPSGHSLNTITARAEELNATLYSIGLDRSCEQSFERMSQLTGGKFFRLQDGPTAIVQLKSILEDEFGQLELDREVQATWLYQSDRNVESIAALMERPTSEIAQSLNRLQKRGLLAVPGDVA